MRITARSGLTNQLIYAGDQSSRIQALQIQASTGKKLQRSSEDPLLASRAKKVADRMEQIKTYQSNIEMSKSRGLYLENAVQEGINTLNKVKALVIQAQNDVASGNDRQPIANQIKMLSDYALSLANQRDENGDYIFSGMNSKTQPFISSNNHYSYQGSHQSTHINIAQDVSVIYADPGQVVFGNKSSNQDASTVFDVLANLVSIINRPVTNESERADYHAQLTRQVDQLTAVMTQMLDYCSVIGTRAQLLAQQADSYEKEVVDQSTNLGYLNETDLMSVISELSMRLTTYDLMNQSYSKIQETLKRLSF